LGSADGRQQSGRARLLEKLPAIDGGHGDSGIMTGLKTLH
jgi:hypothetical protein